MASFKMHFKNILYTRAHYGNVKKITKIVCTIFTKMETQNQHKHEKYNKY